MSDTSDSAPVESTEAGVSDAPVTEAPATSSVLDTELPEGLRSFDRNYVEKVRGEAAENRTKARELEQQLAERDAKLAKFQAFDGYTDEDLGVWSGMATDWKADPALAAQTFQRIALQVLGDPASTQAERADAQAVLDNPAVAEAAEAVTPDKVRELFHEEQTAAQEEARRENAVATVFKQITDAGYEEGTAEMISVLWYANNKTEGNIEEALKLQKESEQRVIDRYVQSMAKGGTPVRLPGNATAGSPAQDVPKNINEARAQAEEWLRERQKA